MAQVELALVAARLRRLVGAERANPEILTRALGVSVSALLTSLEELAPRPAIEVIVAVVQRYGVDPTWLMTGEYDHARHRAALDDIDPPTAAQLTRLILTAAEPADAGGMRPPELTM